MFISVTHSRPQSRTQKILVLGIRYAVELQAWVARVLLQIEGCDLDGFLLVGGQPCEAVDEGVGDAKLHMFCAYAATSTCGQLQSQTHHTRVGVFIGALQML